jgi:hypothetical protein
MTDKNMVQLETDPTVLMYKLTRINDNPSLCDNFYIKLVDEFTGLDRRHAIQARALIDQVNDFMMSAARRDRDLLDKMNVWETVETLVKTKADELCVLAAYIEFINEKMSDIRRMAEKRATESTEPIVTSYFTHTDQVTSIMREAQAAADKSANEALQQLFPPDMKALVRAVRIEIDLVDRKASGRLGVKTIQRRCDVPTNCVTDMLITDIVIPIFISTLGIEWEIKETIERADSEFLNNKH